MNNQALFYWDLSGMTRKDLGGYFRLVEFDELGFSKEPMTEAELENEMQSYAHEFGMSEDEVREYMEYRVVGEDIREWSWERYLQTAGQEA